MPRDVDHGSSITNLIEQHLGQVPAWHSTFDPALMEMIFSKDTGAECGHWDALMRWVIMAISRCCASTISVATWMASTLWPWAISSCAIVTAP